MLQIFGITGIVFALAVLPCTGKIWLCIHIIILFEIHRDDTFISTTKRNYSKIFWIFKKCKCVIYVDVKKFPLNFDCYSENYFYSILIPLSQTTISNCIRFFKFSLRMKYFSCKYYSEFIPWSIWKWMMESIALVIRCDGYNYNHRRLCNLFWI